MKPKVHLQDTFLNKARKEGMGITLYLINGYQIKGYVKGFDNYTILLESENRQQLIYKHAISTITPNTKINIDETNKDYANI